MKVIKTALLVLICFVFLFQSHAAFTQTTKNEPIVKDDEKLLKIIKDCYVPYINTKRLFAAVEHKEYPISPEVEVRENGKKGVRLNIKTLAAVGFITKADIYIMKNEVVKIIILDMQQ